MRCLVIDRREHLGGNTYDEFDAAGVLIHRYGPHFFRSNAPRIIDDLSPNSSACVPGIPPVETSLHGSQTQVSDDFQDAAFSFDPQHTARKGQGKPLPQLLFNLLFNQVAEFVRDGLKGNNLQL
jgi:hypothetical protein